MSLVEPRVVSRARAAVAVVFVANGVAFASIFARTPALRDTFALSPAQLGLLLLCLSGGAVVGLPLSGVVVHRVGPARAVAVAAGVSCTGMAVLAAALLTGGVAAAGAALVLVGLGTGIWDVAMNVEGAAVERHLARSFMPRLHAGFSVGAVGGAGVAAACAALRVPFAAQLLGVAVGVAVVVLVAVRSFLPAAPEPPGREGGVLAAWREPRTVLLGLLVLAFAFTEGSAYDWIAVALVDGHGAAEAVGAAGYGVFVTAMTVVRLVGGALLARFGRVPVLRVSAAVAVAGLLVVVFGPGTGAALAGAALWGAGAALGFPVGMSAASDDPGRAAPRVSVVSSIGYTAFLAGPPLIGLLAERDGVLRGLLVVLAALLVAVLAAGAARPAGERDATASPATGRAR
ncbi:MAG: MFS transporter [Pseudonocardia sp.]